jgi:sugar/nucleoside kinase (ribokinase family)
MTENGSPPPAPRVSRRPVVVLGAHILDVLGRPVESIPPGQGSARLAEIRATVAGTAAGTAIDLAKLGAQVRTIGAVGDDLLAQVLGGEMERHGIDTRGLIRKPAGQTSATILPIRPNGERPALHVPGATALLERADLDLGVFGGAAAVMIGAPDALTGLTAGDLEEVASAAKNAGALLVVDVLRPGRLRDFERIRGLLAIADWFAPNSDQLAALTGQDTLDGGIDAVLALGTGGVAVTLGAQGAVVATRDGGAPLPVPAIAVEVTDTTGCGDAFNAGLITGLLAGAGPVDAAWLGVACGSLVATGLGSDAGITGLDQVLEFLGGHAPGPAGRLTAALAATAIQARSST